MSIAIRGSLFTQDFLQNGITRTPEWKALPPDVVDVHREAIARIIAKLPTESLPNEATTEQDLIWPTLEQLGWSHYLTQQNLTSKGRMDVPDGLLFINEAAKEQANTHADEWKRYGHGAAVIEAKRWNRPLDRRSSRRSEETAPSTQLIRYLRRIDDYTAGGCRWGILTNGARWRLYFSGARSVVEDFIEIDLTLLFDVDGDAPLLGSALSEGERSHWLRVFLLMFGRASFDMPSATKQTFHLRALSEGKFYEERVAKNLSAIVFQRVYPSLANSLHKSVPDADLNEVRHASMIFLYRVLFLLYAEDRDLLPVRDKRFDDYALREKVRGDIRKRKDENDTFSSTQGRYWFQISSLCKALDKGDPSIGLPPYNGGLFDEEKTPLLAKATIADDVIADVIDALSFEIGEDGQRRYINYRDLSVQQLGSIYERLLEFEPVIENGIFDIRPNIFARKGSGSYYTPDDLVGVIINETVKPLINEAIEAFRNAAEDILKERIDEERKLARLERLDPAEAILGLKICDPAMGSGHFLVSLVDFLAVEVIDAMAEAQAIVTWAEYNSPLTTRIHDIRKQIQNNADTGDWTLDDDQLDDRHLISRMVLKRCIYGVDKNQMAVELAKVALWLHTFTVGAPLSFLDHHLACGDSLFGMTVRQGMDKITKKWNSSLLINAAMTKAMASASSMIAIEKLTDAEIAEAQESANIWHGIVEMVGPLDAFLKLLRAFDWLDLKTKEEKTAVLGFLDGRYGDPFDLATGKIELTASGRDADDFRYILSRAKELIQEERFLNWQLTFPGVWSKWESLRPDGGFDAMIGNPPWDKIKLQQVEWFAARRPKIAMQGRASDRKKMIGALEADKDPLFADYAKASDRAMDSLRMAKTLGDYPLLGRGDINLYSLFVERALTLLKPTGISGLLTPSGIASDKGASVFFKSVATTGRLAALYDFENRRTRYHQDPFFPDVDSRFKFCATIVGADQRTFKRTNCAFFLQDVSELQDKNRCFPLAADDFAAVNPNTGTAPIFRSRRDAALTTAIYKRLPVLVDRSSGEEVSTWPVKYSTMFHMTNDSGLFRTRVELEEKEGAFPKNGNVWGSAKGDWLPLYVGRMIHQYDHRAASVVMNDGNVHNAALSGEVTPEMKANPSFSPMPNYWVNASEVNWEHTSRWAISFRDIARATDMRTIIAATVPEAGFGNKAPLLEFEEGIEGEVYVPLLANLNSLVLDYVARSKVQSTSVNAYIVEQFPVVEPVTFANTWFGQTKAIDLVRAMVLELTYTAHDMAPFAKDLGHVDENGEVLPPFDWNEERRLTLKAKLDAIFFWLYGVFDPVNIKTSRDDISYIYSTFPIVERQEMATYHRYLSRDICLAYLNALVAGQPHAEISMTTLPD